MGQGLLVAEGKKTAVLTDAELVSASLGSHGTVMFGELVSRYKGMVMGRVYAIVGDYHEAEDIVQETFLKAFRSLGGLRNPSDFCSWVGTIARNTALSAAAGRRPPASGPRTAPEGDADPGERAVRTEEQSAVISAIESLPEAYRSALYLKHIKEMTCREIASAQGVSVGVITSRLSRGMAKVREKLEPPSGRDDE
jgi:RNA polymerase sigma-70 factor (ECF subfamily)